MLNFHFHRDIWLFIASLWVTVLTLSISSVVLDMEKFILAVVFVLILTPLMLEKAILYKKQKENVEKKFLFSKIGYVIAGVNTGLIFIAIVFNFLYTEGLLDLRDFVFYFLSIPLSIFLNFKPNPENFYLRVALYFITFFNLLIITIILDRLVMYFYKIKESLKI